MFGSDNMTEIWRDVLDYEGLYQVSNLGKVRNTKTLRVLSQGTCGSGYAFVILRKDGKSYNRMVHRLVMNTFCPTKNSKLEVNHIDGNKQNNYLDNLEWVTRSENLQHALNIGLMESQCKIRRKVIVKRDEHIVTFETMKDCATFFGYKKGWLQGQIRKHGCTFNYKGYDINVHERV